MVAINADKTFKFEPPKKSLQIANTKVGLLIDSKIKIVCSILSESVHPQKTSKLSPISQILLLP